MAGKTDLSTSIEGYHLYCLAEGKRPTTIRWYITKLHLFERYLQDQGWSTDVRDLTTTQLRAFLVHLRDNVKADGNNPNKPTRDSPLSGSTLQGYARTLKAFCSWLAREGYVEDNPGRLLKIPKATRMIVLTFSDARVAKLLAVIDRKTPKGLRNYCIMLLLLDTGIRLSELATLQVTDLQGGACARCWARARAKGGFRYQEWEAVSICIISCLLMDVNRKKGSSCRTAMPRSCPYTAKCQRTDEEASGVIAHGGRGASVVLGLAVPFDTAQLWSKIRVSLTAMFPARSVHTQHSLRSMSRWMCGLPVAVTELTVLCRPATLVRGPLCPRLAFFVS